MRPFANTVRLRRDFELQRDQAEARFALSGRSITFVRLHPALESITRQLEYVLKATTQATSSLDRIGAISQPSCQAPIPIIAKLQANRAQPPGHDPIEHLIQAQEEMWHILVRLRQLDLGMSRLTKPWHFWEDSRSRTMLV
jgi:hypothetical protein